MLYVYSQDTDLLLQNIMIPIQDVNFTEEGFIDINVGQHLRDLLDLVKVIIELFTNS